MPKIEYMEEGENVVFHRKIPILTDLRLAAQKLGIDPEVRGANQETIRKALKFVIAYYDVVSEKMNKE